MMSLDKCIAVFNIPLIKMHSIFIPPKGVGTDSLPGDSSHHHLLRQEPLNQYSRLFESWPNISSCTTQIDGYFDLFLFSEI